MISIAYSRYWFIALIIPTGLVLITSGEDHAQKAIANANGMTVRMVVITVERMSSLLSGLSSLNHFTGIERWTVYLT